MDFELTEIALQDDAHGLIRSDAEKDAERLYVFKELLKSADDIKNGRTYSAAEVGQHMDEFIGGFDS